MKATTKKPTGGKSRKAKPIIAHSVVDYPKYYKNGVLYTRVDSKNEFLQVKLMRTGTFIHRGENVHIVGDVQGNDEAITRDAFEAAYNNALNKISLN